jgi:Skp family chaperone for outer membrane proteins
LFAFSQTFFRIPILAVSAFVLSAATAHSLEIPLKKGSGEGTRVGYVDMERIFRDYPETQKARAEYFKEVERQRAALAERERQLAGVVQEIDMLQEAVQPPADSTSTVASSTGAASPVLSSATVAAVQEGVAKRAANLEQRQTELSMAKQAAAQTLRDLEAKRSRQILGSLHKALVDLAEEKGIGLVVDKSAILYGQSAIDLTDALSRRVRGLPEEEGK